MKKAKRTAQPTIATAVTLTMNWKMGLIPGAPMNEPHSQTVQTCNPAGTIEAMKRYLDSNCGGYADFTHTVN